MAHSPSDEELDALFGNDLELLNTAHRLRAARPQPLLDPRFPSVLRAQLMREASTVLAPRRRRWLVPGMGHIAWGSGALGLAMVVALVVILNRPLGPDQTTLPQAMSNVSAQKAVSTTGAITLSFNQPMDENAVVAGLHIEPATQATYAWSDAKTLRVTPAHPLAGNTPYVVTIDHAAARSAAGMSAPADIHISFGTEPTPTPVPVPLVTPPSLQLSVVNAADPAAATGFSPDGDPVTNSAILPAPSAAPTPTPSTPSLLPSLPVNLPSLGLTPAPSPSAAVGPGGTTAVFPAAGPTRLGGASHAFAFSPDGRQLVLAIPSAQGGDDIVVSHADGSSPTTLTTLSGSATGITWSDRSTVVVAQSGSVESVDLQHRVVPLLTQPGSILLAPGGRSALVLPPAVTSQPTGNPGATPSAPDGVLYGLDTQAQRTLAGSSSGVFAFSGDGASVAWVDRSQATRRLLISAVASDTTRQIPSTNQRGDRVSEVDLSRDAKSVAYIVVRPSAAPTLVIARSDGGAIVGELSTRVHDVSFSPTADRIAMVGPGGLTTAPLPGGASSTPLTPSIPAEAQQTLDTLVAAQVAHDAAALHALGTGPLDLTALTPLGLTRGYVISATQTDGGTVEATARLLIDPATGAAATQLTTEMVTLTLTGGSWKVSGLSAPRLTTEPPGPHVTRVSSASDQRNTVVTVTFDSDLQSGSAAQAISLARGGRPVDGAKVSYDDSTHTATVTYPSPTPGSVTLTVGTGLTDVAGQHMATAYTTSLG